MRRKRFFYELRDTNGKLLVKWDELHISEAEAEESLLDKASGLVASWPTATNFSVTDNSPSYYFSDWLHVVESPASEP